MLDLNGLPGADLVTRGLLHLERGEETLEALLVAIGWPRLEQAGVRVPESARRITDPELRLYAKVGEIDPGNAYGTYNSLVRTLVSFEQALDHRVRRA